MILNNAPQAEAVLSNVGEIGEFRIRNSAKAFNILSSGLYANKIRAIIRELSCNAVDSHTAAGNDAPFEVHLPTNLEPFFYVRDFGTGLSHEQVSNIYTTYFESTKTDSNAFIGALGLGSKSPFSYTDNFTVTAIKDGRKGIYSAFINAEGVPSIALMGEEQTDEPSGVEVKFSVNDRWDFDKFYKEAQTVYAWFSLMPNVTGVTDFKLHTMQYESKDIIPGVHSRGDNERSYAVMGNIAYPIEVPQSNTKDFGELSRLLNCGLVMHFGIGELDFQASREGLSYIPQTIQSIKKKLEQINVALTKVLAAKADAIVNEWERSIFLHDARRKSLWAAAVIEYVTNTKFDLMSDSVWGKCILEIKEQDLKDLNIQIKAFTADRHVKGFKNHKPGMKAFGKTDASNLPIRESFYDIPVESDVYFVVNDTKVGALERSKHHWRNKENRGHHERVIVVEAVDRSKPMLLAAFYNMLHNPPSNSRINASTLMQKDRASNSGGIAKNVTILQIETRGGRAYHRSSEQLVWRDAGKLDQFDSAQTYYYVPLSGFATKFTKFPSHINAQELTAMLHNTRLSEFKINVYGVRKSDIETIQSQSNWINIETYVFDVLEKIKDKVAMAKVTSGIDRHPVFDYNYKTVVKGLVSELSAAKAVFESFGDLPSIDGISAITQLMRFAKIESVIDVQSVVNKYNSELKKFDERYPLLRKLGHYAKEEDVCHYVNLIDSVKGV